MKKQTQTWWQQQKIDFVMNSYHVFTFLKKNLIYIYKSLEKHAVCIELQKYSPLKAQMIKLKLLTSTWDFQQHHLLKHIYFFIIVSQSPSKWSMFAGILSFATPWIIKKMFALKHKNITMFETDDSYTSNQQTEIISSQGSYAFLD